MASDQHPGGSTFGRRLEKWVRDSAELRTWVQGVRGGPATPEEAALRRYQRSTTKPVALPHPAISQRRYDALDRRRREVAVRLALALSLIPLLVTLAVLVGPVVAQVAIGALVLPLAALAVHDSRALTRIGGERHLTLQGGLADAWADWVTARNQLEALDGAAQARAALGANEARMQMLVLALSQAEPRLPQETGEHQASREWVYRTAAKAAALAQAERELEEATQLQVDAGVLQLAPDGDSDALDHALEAARELRRGATRPPLP